MAKYTMTIKEICEYLYSGDTYTLETANFNNAWGGGFNTTLPNPFIGNIKVDDIITDVRTKFFDFDYVPSESETLIDKETLERKILKHYYMYEIGFETYERFKLALNERLNLIMPYYLELAKSMEFNKENPLSNTEYFEERTTDNEGESHDTKNGTTSSNSSQWYEDTPSSKLGNDTDYATSITKYSGSGTDSQTDNGTTKNNEEMNRHIWGLNGYSKQDMIRRYRENIVNIDDLLIRELADLFMLLY